MRTSEVLKEVLDGKKLSENSKLTYRAVFRSVGKMYEEFPTKPVQINKWIVSLEGYSEETVRLWVTLLRVACMYMEVNYDMKSPCKGIKSPKVRNRKRRYFSVGEIARIIRECRSDYDMALVTTLIDSGCRVGGLPGLKGIDVGDGWLNLKEKTGERRYRLDDKICENLKRMAGSDEGLVFGLSAAALSMRVRRLCLRAGLKGKHLGAHTFRHSSASLVAKDTKNVMAVKALLQHDNIQTSMIYIHDMEEELQQGISPLKLVVDKMKESGDGVQKMLVAGGDGDDEIADEVVDEGYDELVAEMYPEIRDNIEIRPLLRSEDIRMLREMMMRHAMDYKADALNQKGRDLLKRMLRKVK